MEHHPPEITIRSCLELARGAVSQPRVLSRVEGIARHHRIQASPGYREAAKDCVERALADGLRARLLSYPARLETTFYTQRLFKEWSCRSARLELCWPKTELLADFELDDMSIIQRSAPADGRELEIRLVPPDADPMCWDERLDGALLFVENGFERWVERAAELGAAGILTVSMPEMPPVRTDMVRDSQMADKCANLSFHLNSADQENRLFGFALTPRQGEELRNTCLELAKEDKRPRARAYVDSELRDGRLENVLAEIEGTGPEEILMVAHLCHPKSSVNDNASGAACALEAMAALQALISSGDLPIPRRSIRMLLVPEFTGTYAYLATRGTENLPAGLNLDMVAGRQDGDAGPLLCIQTPDSAPSPVNDLAGALMEELQRECPLGGNGEMVPLFLGQVKPYMMGSDHAILSDPTVGAPTVALTQWPEKTYHTSADCLAHIDPGLLARVSSFAAAYVYLLASPTPGLAEELLPYTRRRFFGRLTELTARRDRGEDTGEEARWLLDRALATCDGYLDLLPAAPAFLARLDRERSYLAALFALEFPTGGGAGPQPSGPIPVRRFTGPPAMRSILAELPRALRTKYADLMKRLPGLGGLDDQILFWVDGRSAVEEIAQKVRWETGKSCEEYVALLLDFFHEAKLISYQKREEG